MIGRQLFLTAGTLLPWLLLLPMTLKEGWAAEGHLLHSTIAALLCLICTSATMMWCDLVVGKSPEQQLVAVLGGTAVRMGFVIVVATALYYNLPDFHYDGFWLWILGFYLWTLTIEMVLISRRQAAMEKATHPNSSV